MTPILSAFCSLSFPPCRHKQHKYPRIRSQRFSDDGASASIVDANLGILRRRIEEARMKERLDTWCRLKNYNNGWNYQYSGDDIDHDRQKRDAELVMSGCLELMGSIGGAFGFVFLSGSLFIFLVSVLVHWGK
ncbi:hypothetical protein Tsubulata_048539 [Turnera subulata]|uniref:Uncharacterized protein n=1 Tax=Turnera subulata TaxID=218843 RepID=A0A9Q0EY20_9ROSI|nr:hypothetical protein Tsubulata_048539 [Turnera subulata]